MNPLRPLAGIARRPRYAAFDPFALVGAMGWDAAHGACQDISGTTPCTNNTPCAYLPGKTGATPTATQVTLAKRPTWIASGLNGLPVIRGDGVSASLTLGSDILLTTTAGFALYFVGNRTSGTQWQPLGNTSSRDTIAEIFSNNNAYLSDDAGNVAAKAYTGATGGTAVCWRCAAGGAVTFSATGQSASTAAGSLSGNATFSALLTQAYRHQCSYGDLAWWLIVPSAVSGTTHGQVAAWISDRFGVALP